MAEEPIGKPSEGTPPSPAKAGDPTAGSKVEFSPEQQAKLDEILKRERKDWEKQHKESFDKAKLADQLLAEKKQKDDAEKTELQRLTDEITALKGRASKADEYEATLNKLLELKMESIPEDKRGMLDELPNVSTKLAWIEKYGAVLFGTQAGTLGPGGGKPPAKKTDPLDEKAAAAIERMYGEELKRLPKDQAEKRRAELIERYKADLERRQAVAG